MGVKTYGTMAVALAFAAVLQAQEGTIVTPPEIAWPGTAASGGLGTSGASGIQTVVLAGDPAKRGLYTLRLKVAPNVRIQAHSHADERSAVVLSGTWHFGYGRQFDEKKLKALPPGSFYTEPANIDHFAMTREAVVLQITGFGPSSTTYVEATQDPGRRP